MWHLRYPANRVLPLQSGLRLAVREVHVTPTVPMAGLPSAQMQVRIQACDDKPCMAPSVLTVAR